MNPAGLAAYKHAVLLLRSKNGEEYRVPLPVVHYTQPVAETLPVP